MKNELHPVTIAIKDLLRQMVSQPRFLRVIEEQDGQKLDIYIFPAQTDFRIVCGKKGRMVNSLSYIAERAGLLNGQEIELHLEESFKGDIEEDREFTQNPEVDVERLLLIVRQLCEMLMSGPREITCERDNDELDIRVKIDHSNPSEIACLSALSDVVYTIGYKNGITAKVNKQRAEEVV